MDYSLLVGVHNLDRAQREKAEERMAEGRVDEEGGGGGGEQRSMLTRTRSVRPSLVYCYYTAADDFGDGWLGTLRRKWQSYQYIVEWC